MTTAGESGALLAANAAFYEQFEARDLDGMAAVWDHGDAVYCVHPGGERIVGWGAVRRSWALIFASADHLQFIVTDAVAAAEGDAGWVTCTENVLSGRDDSPELGAGRAVATNLFARRGGHWRMTAHHASPVLRPAGG